MTRAVFAIVERKLRAYRSLQRAKSKNARAWCEAIQQTLQEYEHTGEPGKARLCLLRYFEGRTEEQVRELLFVGRGTYYKWKNDVICTVAFNAARRGLL